MNCQSRLNGTCPECIQQRKSSMCGRFVSARKRLELLEEFGVTRDRVAASPDPEPEPDYNVAPTKRVYAVLTRNSDKDSSDKDSSDKDSSDKDKGAGKDEDEGERAFAKARELRV